MTTLRFAPALLAGLLLSGSLLLAGCSSSTPPAPAAPEQTSAAGPPVTMTPRATVQAPPVEQTGDIFELAVGDCLNDGEESRVSEVPTVNCSSPHDLEVFYEFDLTDSVFRGTEALTATAQSGCAEQFEPFVGITYDESKLGATQYIPTESSWASGDRTVICVLGDPNGKSTGTLRGAGV